MRFNESEKKQIAALYGNKCVLCLQPWGAIHHLRPVSTHPELACDPDNCVPLCDECHWVIHNMESPAVVYKVLRKRAAQLRRVYAEESE